MFSPLKVWTPRVMESPDVSRNLSNSKETTKHGGGAYNLACRCLCMRDSSEPCIARFRKPMRPRMREDVPSWMQLSHVGTSMCSQASASPFATNKDEACQSGETTCGEDDRSPKMACSGAQCRVRRRLVHYSGARGVKTSEIRT